MKQEEIMSRLLEFSSESMKWCVAQSEESVTQVTHVLDILMKDAARISKMSTETLEAVSDLQARLKGVRGKDGDMVTSELIGALKGLAAEHVEVQDFSAPLIEALQFHDMVRQRMENLARMTKIWIEFRSSGPASDPQALVEFGKKLLTCTTMQEERDIIRKSISGLPAEEKAQDVMLF